MSNITHIEPINDSFLGEPISHETNGMDCHCNPTIEDVEIETNNGMFEGTLVVHHSYDLREHEEEDHVIKDCDFCVEREILKHMPKFRKGGERYDETERA